MWRGTKWSASWYQLINVFYALGGSASPLALNPFLAELNRTPSNSTLGTCLHNSTARCNISDGRNTSLIRTEATQLAYGYITLGSTAIVFAILHLTVNLNFKNVKAVFKELMLINQICNGTCIGSEDN